MSSRSLAPPHSALAVVSYRDENTQHLASTETALGAIQLPLSCVGSPVLSAMRPRGRFGGPGPSPIVRRSEETNHTRLFSLHPEQVRGRELVTSHFFLLLACVSSRSRPIYTNWCALVSRRCYATLYVYAPDTARCRRTMARRNLSCQCPLRLRFSQRPTETVKLWPTRVPGRGSCFPGECYAVPRGGARHGLWGGERGGRGGEPIDAALIASEVCRRRGLTLIFHVTQQPARGTGNNTPLCTHYMDSVTVKRHEPGVAAGRAAGAFQ